MESPRGLKVPDNWLIDTGMEYWPLQEGIWVNDQTSQYLRLACIYQGLMDLPEAKRHLDDCNKHFLDNNADTLLCFVNSIKQKAVDGVNFNIATVPFLNDEQISKVASIYQERVDSWVMGSSKMLMFAGGINVFNVTFSLAGLKPDEIQRLATRIKKMAGRDNLPWAWQTLLSGDYRRLDETKRELARRSVQSTGYFRMRERTMWKHAYYWVMVRILGFSETDLIEKLTLPVDRTNFSKIFKPFDESLLEKDDVPRPGRPYGAKTTERSRLIHELLK